MTLSALIRKGGLVQVATATPATLATHEAMEEATVAGVATVAVAKVDTLRAEDEAAILAWLAHIGETDALLINEVLDKCRAEKQALFYYLKRAEVVNLPNDFGKIGDRQWVE